MLQPTLQPCFDPPKPPEIQGDGWLLEIHCVIILSRKAELSLGIFADWPVACRVVAVQRNFQIMCSYGAHSTTLNRRGDQEVQNCCTQLGDRFLQEPKLPWSAGLHRELGFLHSGSLHPRCLRALVLTAGRASRGSGL